MTVLSPDNANLLLTDRNFKNPGVEKWKEELSPNNGIWTFQYHFIDSLTEINQAIGYDIREAPEANIPGNQSMIRTGAAWAYTQYLTDDDIKQAEIKARNAKVGLWSLQADQIMPPWEWRHGGKNRSAVE